MQPGRWYNCVGVLENPSADDLAKLQAAMPAGVVREAMSFKVIEHRDDKLVFSFKLVSDTDEPTSISIPYRADFFGTSSPVIITRAVEIPLVELVPGNWYRALIVVEDVERTRQEFKSADRGMVKNLSLAGDGPQGSLLTIDFRVTKEKSLSVPAFDKTLSRVSALYILSIEAVT
jgi:hypothetical protein